jgi:hypothetical protein
MAEPLPPRRTVAGRLLALAGGALVAVAVAEGVVRFLMPNWPEFHSGRFMRLTPIPGHGAIVAGVPGFDGWFAQNNGDFRVRVQLNDIGLRNPEPAAGAQGRIWIVGDSLAFGWGVDREDMYSTALGRLLGRPTYNVASPGTNVCGYQALVARMPRAAEPKAVIVGVVVENDVKPLDCRELARTRERELAAEGRLKGGGLHTSDVKGFIAARSALYNFLAVALKRVDWIVAALQAVGAVEEDHVYHRQVEPAQAAAAVERTAAEIERLKAMLPAGVPFAVLLAPARFDIRDGDPFFRGFREAAAAALRARGIAVIDPFRRFQEAGFAATHFRHDGHWSPLGHRLAAEEAAAWLKARLAAGG